MNIKLGLILGAVIFGLGFYTAKRLTIPLEVIKDRIVSQEVTKTVTVTVPGKIVTTTVTSATKKEDKITTIPVPDKKKDYSLGIGYGSDSYTASVGRRMVGDLWLEVTASSNRNLSAGIRYEF